MPNLHLTDLSVRALKGSEKYVTYWDTTTPGFGVRVGKRSKTWTVMRGRNRERVSVGQYGAVTLSDARREAMRLLSEVTDVPLAKPVAKTIKEARSEFIAEHYRGNQSHWPHLVKLMLDKRLKAIEHKQLSDVTDADIRRMLDNLSATPSAQLHLYRATRTFLSWCTRPPRRYLARSPMDGYPAPGRDRKGTRILTDDELRAVWDASGAGSRQVIRLLILWGTRNAETSALRRSWIRDGVLTIPGAHTKNGRDHGIPILPLAASLLDDRPLDGEFYFPGRHSNEIMSPWEILANIAFMKEHTLPSSSAETMFRHLNRFAAAWEALWGQHGSSTDAIPAYRGLLAALHQQFMHSGVDSVMLRNGMRTIDAVKWWIFQSALPVPSASVSQQRVS